MVPALLHLLLTSAAPAATPLGVHVLSGPIWDGNQGPLLSGEIYHALGDLQVPAGQILTVEPGAIVKFAPTVDLFVEGQLEVNLADQTTASFTSLFDDTLGGDSNGDGGATHPARGDWNGVILSSTTAVSTVRGAEIRWAGGGTYHALTARLSSAGGHAIDHVVVRESSSAGIDLQSLENVSVTNCTIEHCSGGSIVGVDPDVLALLSNNTASDCADVLLGLSLIDTDLDQSADLARQNLLQGVLPGPLHVKAGARLTLREGVVVKCLGPSTPFQVDGELHALGTASEPVTFTSLHDDAAGGDHDQDGGATSPKPGDWNGILMGATTGDCVLQHTGVRYSKSRHLRGAGVSLLLEDCVFEQGADHGLELWDADLAATLRRCTVRDNAGVAIDRAQWQQLPHFEDLVLTNNAKGDVVRVNGGSFANPVVVGPANLGGNTLVVNASVVLEQGQLLRFLPGVVVKLTTGVGFDVKEGVLDLAGLPPAPVVLTSIHDDTVGGDTEKDGAATSPAPGNWGRVRYQTFPTAPESLCRFVDLRYGGAGGPQLELTGDRELHLEQVRSVHSAAEGFRITRARYPARSLVAADNTNEGIEIQESRLESSTSTANLGEGIDYHISNASAVVVDCVSWANGAANFGRLTDQEVAYSDGGFAGVNGNLDVDPQFVDPAGLDLRLSATSPCIDRATPGSIPPGMDAEGLPRVLDGDADGSLRLDMGAHEFGRVRLVVLGEPTAGNTLTLVTDGPAGWKAWLLVGVGFGDGAAVLNGLGNVFLDFSKPWFLIRWAAMPSSVPAPLPPDLPVGFEILLQELGVGGGAGMLSNPWFLTVEPT